MKLTITLLLLAGAALAEEAPCVPIPNGTGSAGSCAVQPAQPHLADVPLRDYFRKLAAFHEAQMALQAKEQTLPEYRALQKAQIELDEASEPLMATCKNGIAPDAAKGFDCAKAPDKPAEKVK